MKVASEASGSAAIEVLNSFLRCEMAAVESYDRALDSLQETGSEAIPEIRLNRECHCHRARLLRDHIRWSGGEPIEDSGLWGVCVKLVEGGAARFGLAAAIAALEEGEHRSLAQFRRDTMKLEDAERHFVETDLLPAQLVSLDRLRRARWMSAAGKVGIGGADSPVRAAREPAPRSI